MGHVQDTIDVGAVGLPTLCMFKLLWLELCKSPMQYTSPDDVKEVIDMSRRIPPYNATTSDTAEVYDLHDIILETNGSDTHGDIERVYKRARKGCAVACA